MNLLEYKLHTLSPKAVAYLERKAIYTSYITIHQKLHAYALDFKYDYNKKELVIISCPYKRTENAAFTAISLARILYDQDYSIINSTIFNHVKGQDFILLELVISDLEHMPQETI